MPNPARPCSISLGPRHQKRLQQVQDRIRSAVKAYPGRSEAIQVALLGFEGDAKKIKELVALNRRENDGRRRP